MAGLEWHRLILQLRQISFTKTKELVAGFPDTPLPLAMRRGLIQGSEQEASKWPGGNIVGTRRGGNSCYHCEGFTNYCTWVASRAPDLKLLTRIH